MEGASDVGEVEAKTLRDRKVREQLEAVNLGSQLEDVKLRLSISISGRADAGGDPQKRDEVHEQREKKPRTALGHSRFSPPSRLRCQEEVRNRQELLPRLLHRSRSSVGAVFMAFANSTRTAIAQDNRVPIQAIATRIVDSPPVRWVSGTSYRNLEQCLGVLKVT